jgi:MAPEG family
MRDQKLQTIHNARNSLILGFVFSAFITILAWLILYVALAPVPNMVFTLDRLVFAFKCWAMATLFCLVLGIEAVAHERLGTFGVSALGDGESLRLRINQRYLQQTIEQMLVFVPGLLLLAIYCETSESMRVVEIATIMWIVARFVFWLGYHHDVQIRAPGMVSTLQSFLILLYGCTRFGYEIAGVIGAILVISAFVSVELYLLSINRL